MKIRRIACALALSVPLLSAGAATAAAPETRSPWTPYEAHGWTLPAGASCDFPLRGDVLQDKERVRTTERYADGSPRVQEFTGQLVMRFTNLDSGGSVVRNLTGRADVEYLPDGSWTMTLVGGHFAAGIRPGGDPGPGFYVVTGTKHQLVIEPDGHRTLVPGDGPVEDVCDTLA